jgi:type II secretory pathway component PulJ
MRTSKTQSLGFTLIEAIVAMTIIGMTMLPVMVLISQSMTQLIRVQDINERAQAVKTALAIIEPINPATSPTGQVSTGNTSITWNSSIIVQPNSNVQTGSGLAGYSISFHNVKVDILQDNEVWFSFNLRKVGYQTLYKSGIPGTDY